MEEILENKASAVSAASDPGTKQAFSSSLSVKEPFTAERRELICALLSYIMAFAWTKCGFSPLELLLTAVLLVLLCEVIQKGVVRSRESLVWLSCFWICVIALFIKELGQYGLFNVKYVLPFCRVWDESQQALFVHLFAVWWVISRSGKLLKGESSRYLPADALNAFIIVPFSGLILRARVLIHYLRELLNKRRARSAGRSEESPKRRNNIIWLVLAVALSAALFVFAGQLLSQADRGFAEWYTRITDLLRIDWKLDPEIINRIVFSIPVGMYLFGLIDGSRRYKKEKLEYQLNGIDRFLASIHKIPENFWAGVIAVFSLLYLSFFVIQASYLFGAFTRTLPEGFIVSRYAREGFFELCKVVALNFSLLWIVTRMVRLQNEQSASKRSKCFLAACLALLAESAIFAVVAFSKLALYIDCFGFTPLRFQSIWLVFVLFAGCVLWAVSMITNRSVFRLWMYIGAISLSLLSLY